MKYQEEFRESPCELFKQELEQDSSTGSCAFSDKSHLLNASSQGFRFTLIVNVKIRGDITNFSNPVTLPRTPTYEDEDIEEAFYCCGSGAM